MQSRFLLAVTREAVRLMQLPTVNAAYHSKCHGPLARYIKLEIAYVLGIPGTFSLPLRVSYPSMHHSTSLTLSQCTLAGPVYTGMPLVDPVYTGTPLEKLSWNSPTLECHWRNSNFYSIHWNTTGGTVTAHTRPDAYSLACRVASMPVWNDKMAGHQ